MRLRNGRPKVGGKGVDRSRSLFRQSWGDSWEERRVGWGDGWLNGVAIIQDEVWDAREGGDGRTAAYLGGSIAVSTGSLRASSGAVGYGSMQGRKETRGERWTRREGKICRRKKQTNAEEEEEMNARPPRLATSYAPRVTPCGEFDPIVIT